jgi:uncharacterized LabA/DUF88 family protein
MHNIAIFADLSNMHFGLRKKWPEGRLSYSAYLQRAIAGDNCVRSIAYATLADEDSAGFLTAIASCGWEVKHKKPLEVRTKGGTVVRRLNWNLEITCDMFRLAPKINKVILGCSNSDLIEPVKLMQSMGIYVHVLAAYIGRGLAEVANKSEELTEDFLLPKNAFVPELRTEAENAADPEPE